MAYPDPLPARIPFYHKGSVSSGGAQTTVGANTAFDYAATPLNSIRFVNHSTTTDYTVKFNGESAAHLVQKNSNLGVDNFQVTSFIIVESGAEYSYSGLYFRS